MEVAAISKSTNSRFKWLGNTIVVIVIAFVLYLRLPTMLANYQLEGTRFPDQALQTLSLEPFQFPTTLDSEKLLIFWASWCGPCTNELARLQSAIDEKEITAKQVLAINLGESPQTVKRIAKKRNYTFSILLDQKGELANKLKIKYTPTTLILSPEREITWATTGPSPTLSFRLRSL